MVFLGKMPLRVKYDETTFSLLEFSGGVEIDRVRQVNVIMLHFVPLWLWSIPGEWCKSWSLYFEYSCIEKMLEE